MPTVARTAASIVGLVAVVLLALFVACGSGSSDRSTATPTASVVVTGSPTPTAATPAPAPISTPLPPQPLLYGNTLVTPLTVGEAVSMPTDIAAIYCCSRWHGRALFSREYQDPARETRIGALVDFSKLAPAVPYCDIVFPPCLDVQALSNPDRSEFYAAHCTHEGCLGGQAVFRSVDGGVTWNLFAETEEGGSIVAWVDSGKLLATAPGPIWYTLPDELPVTPPDEVTGLYQPIAVAGQILWPSEAGLFDSDGEAVAGFAPHSYNFGPPVSLAAGRHALSWAWFDDASERTQTIIGLLDPSDRPTRLFSWRYSHTLLADLGDGMLLTHTAFQPNQLPDDFPSTASHQLFAVLDTSTGVLHPVYEFADSLFSLLPFVAVQTGAFARVLTPGSCLNIHEFAGVDASILTCAADGVLLRYDVPLDRTEADWLSVTTPSGVEGWASAEYLEY